MHAPRQVLMYYSADPARVKRRLLRFRQAFLAQGDGDFVIVSYDKRARTHQAVFDAGGINIDWHIYGPDIAERLAYPVKGRTTPFALVPGNTDLVPLMFYHSHPGYAHYWLLEDDVDYSGDPADLFGPLWQREGSLLATHLARGERGWTYVDMLRSPDPCVTVDDTWLVFLPFCRIDAAGLAAIDAAYRAGWGGHSEMMWATILKRAGLDVVDIGGDGKYVAPADRHLRYYGLPENGFAKVGSFGTLRIRLRTGREPDLLWHPVKPLGPWLRQSAKRLLSILEWYTHAALEKAGVRRRQG